MKKYIGACASALAGILTFVFLSLDGILQTATIAGVSNSDGLSAWEILKKDGSNTNGYVLYKIAVIAMIVLACLLILSAIVIILREAKVFKSKVKLNVLNNVLLAVFALATILAFIGACVMGGDMSAGETIKTTAGIGSWLNMVVGVISCATGWLFASKK